MDLLYKLKKIKLLQKKDKFEDINPDEIVDINNLRLIFEEDEQGNLAKYSFAKIDQNKNLVILHDGKVLTKNTNHFVCETKVLSKGANMATTHMSPNLKDIFFRYSNNPTLVGCRIERNFSTSENKKLYNEAVQKYEEVKNKGLSLKKDSYINFVIFRNSNFFVRRNIWPTTRFILNDSKHLFINSENNNIQIKDLLEFENHLNQIAFKNNGKNYPIEFEKEVINKRQEIYNRRKKSISTLGVVYDIL